MGHIKGLDGEKIKLLGRFGINYKRRYDMINLFKLAEIQLNGEVRSRQRKNFTLIDVIDYAYMVRKHIDYQDRGKAISKAKGGN